MYDAVDIIYQGVGLLIAVGIGVFASRYLEKGLRTAFSLWIKVLVTPDQDSHDMDELEGLADNICYNLSLCSGIVFVLLVLLVMHSLS